MTTTKLSDSQLVILSAACARDDGAVFPITASLKGGALNKVLHSLIAKGLVEEVPAAVGDTVWRDEDEGRLTLRATAVACEALGIDAEDDDTPPSGGAGVGVSAAEPEPASLGAAAASGNRGNVAATRGRGAENAGTERATAPKATTAPDRADTGKVRSGTKQALLIDLLRRKEGTTIAEIVAATGWLPHTARGAMAGALKKRLGLAIDSEKVEGRGRVYRIVD